MMKVVYSPRFYPLLLNEYRELILYGGGGSGKSEFAGRKIFTRCRDEGNHRVLIIRKVRKTLKDSCLELMKNVLNENGVKFRENKSDMDIFFRATTGHMNTILFRGLDDREKIKSIKGITMVWIEEATELSADDFRQINLRIREQTPYYKQIMLTFNPDAARGKWIRDLWFPGVPHDFTGPGPRRNSYLHHSTINDNPIDDIVAEYKHVLAGLDDPTYESIYGLGRWAAAKGLIYHFKTGPLPNLDEAWYDDIFYGGDFGYSINPVAFVKIYRKAMRFWIRTLIYQTGLTNPNVAQAIKDHDEADPEAMSFWDPAEPKSIQELQDNGINAFEAIKGPDSVEFGINLLQTLDITIINDPTSDEPQDPLIDEQHGYKWATDRNGEPLPKPKPVKLNDHALDGGRYGIYTVYLKYLRPAAHPGQVYHRGMRPRDELDAIKESKRPPGGIFVDGSGAPTADPPDPAEGTEAMKGEKAHGQEGRVYKNW